MTKQTRKPVVRAPVTEDFLEKVKDKANRIGSNVAEVMRTLLEEWLDGPDELIIRKRAKK